MLQRLSEYRRSLNLIGFAICASLLALAYILQYVGGMDPCPLCIFQRVAFVGLGLAFLLAAIHNPAGWGARVYAGLLLVLAGIGSALAGRHLWLQSLPPERVPACGPGLEYMMEMFPLFDVFQIVLAGSGECAEVERILGFSIPGWTLLAFVGLAVGGVASNWGRRGL